MLKLVIFVLVSELLSWQVSSAPERRPAGSLPSERETIVAIQPGSQVLAPGGSVNTTDHKNRSGAKRIYLIAETPDMYLVFISSRERSTSR
jgi:hypothetical protein